MSVTRPVLRYHGGKWRLGPWLLSQMPEHRVYVEPYGGGANVLLQKDRVPAEIYNDLDGRVVNVFRCLQDERKAAKIRRRLSLTPFAREEFNRCYEPPVDDVDAACKFICLGYMGYGTDSSTRSCRTGFRGKMSDGRATPAQPWANYYEAIDDFTERLRGVLIESRPAVELIPRIDTPATVFLVDPPYVLATRSALTRKGVSAARPSHGYLHEMTDDNHRELAAVLHGVKGMVMLCGYPSALYGELYGGWQRIERKALADGAKARTECLWFNPAAWAARPQAQLYGCLGGGARMLIVIPCELQEANDFVTEFHRHHGPVRGHKFSIAAWTSEPCKGGTIVGVCIVGRPVSRHMDDGWTLEVTRLSTDGTRNACSLLYASAWRAARAMGYRRLVTYVLDTEPGTSLRAVGWRLVAEVRGRSWHCESRPRVDKHPTQGKMRYEVTA